VIQQKKQETKVSAPEIVKVGVASNKVLSEDEIKAKNQQVYGGHNTTGTLGSGEENKKEKLT